MMTADQLATMERDGFVTLDTPFSREEIDAAVAAGERACGGKADVFSDEGLADPAMLRLILHPFVEAVAKQMLRSNDVGLRAVALRKTSPRAGAAPALEGEHADIRFTLDDVDATPRRILCTILIWLSDVTPTRAPFMFRPGSLRQIAAHWTGPAVVAAHHLAGLPKLDYAEPVPVLVRAGQISVGSTGAIHCGSINTDTKPRIVIFTQFQARGVPPVTFDAGQQKGFDEYMTKVRPIVGPSREHLLW